MSGKSRKQQIEELLQEDPNDPFLCYGLAMEHASAGDDPGARGCLEDLLKVSPDYVPAYLQLGQALIRLGEDGQARQVLQAGIATARRQGDLHAAGEMEGFLDSI